ncbi:hypothetical protein HDU86_004105 [Geranomyces michiganensis]|nr:hypothetical protein HDU86_004105 [Geranomyces michiganensis]
MTAPFPHSQLTVGPPADDQQLSPAPVAISFFPPPPTPAKEPRRSLLVPLSNVFSSRSALNEGVNSLPPACPHFLLSQAAAHAVPSSTASSLPVVLVGAAPFLSAILSNSAPSPFDLPSFIAYSRKQYAAELPESYLAIQAFRKCAHADHYKEEAEWILDQFVCEKAERQVNVSVRAQREAIAKVEKGDRKAFDAVLSEVFGLMASEV